VTIQSAHYMLSSQPAGDGRMDEETNKFLVLTTD
jgi:hypothetical protein